MSDSDNSHETEGPSYVEEAILSAAEKKFKKDGTPVSQTLRETEESALQKEDTHLLRIIKRIQKNLFGN